MFREEKNVVCITLKQQNNLQDVRNRRDLCKLNACGTILKVCLMSSSCDLFSDTYYNFYAMILIQKFPVVEHPLQTFNWLFSLQRKKKKEVHCVLNLNLSNLNFKPLNLVKPLSARLKSHQLSIFVPFDNRYLQTNKLSFNLFFIKLID